MHLFFDTVWKLHIGEIPEKRFDVRKFSEGIEKYNQEITAIKANALTVLNPEIGIVESSCGTKCMIDGYVGWDRVPLHTPIQPDKFYKWTGGYEILKTLHCDEYHQHTKNSCFTTVAILTLPEEKKNTMENTNIINSDKEFLKWIYERMICVHGEKDMYDYMINFKAIIDHSGSVAAPKEEEKKKEERVFANIVNNPLRNWEEDYEHENGKYQGRCLECKEWFYGHKRRVICKICADATPDWEKMAQKKAPTHHEGWAWQGCWADGEMTGFARCMVKKVKPLESELESLRQQLKEREEALKELLPIAERKFNGISIDDAHSHREYVALKAIIEKARKLISK